MGGAKLLQDLQGGKTDTSQASKIELQISMEQLYTGTEFVQPVRRKVRARRFGEAGEDLQARGFAMPVSRRALIRPRASCQQLASSLAIVRR